MSGLAGAAATAVTSERLVDRAYRQIRDEIIALRLQPGAPLDERAISESLELGFTPIRDAVKRLVLEKLAVSYPRRGTYVAQINLADEVRLTEVRIELEGLAAALAAVRSTPNDRTRLLQAMAELESGSQERSDHTELDARVHRVIYAAAHNDFLESTLNQYANLALRIWNYRLQEHRAAGEHVASQRTVVDAIVRADASSARAAAEQHLRVFSDQVRALLQVRP